MNNNISGKWESSTSLFLPFESRNFTNIIKNIKIRDLKRLRSNPSYTQLLKDHGPQSRILLTSRAELIFNCKSFFILIRQNFISWYVWLCKSCEFQIFQDVPSLLQLFLTVTSSGWFSVFGPRDTWSNYMYESWDTNLSIV